MQLVEQHMIDCKDPRYSVIDADSNGAYNIIRKVAPDAFRQAEGVEDGKGMLASLVVHPVRIVIPRTKPKSKRLTAEASGH